jgi:hypothetical protein
MNVDLKSLLPPALALLILIVIGVQTSSALKDVGSRTRRKPDVQAADPYMTLDLQIARSRQPAELIGIRDPFRAVSAARPVATRTTTPRPRPVAIAVPPPRPIVTAIIADEDPRALISYENKNYSVKTGDLFAEFRVVSVNAERVLIEGPGGQLVLRRPIKGD